MKAAAFASSEFVHQRVLEHQKVLVRICDLAVQFSWAQCIFTGSCQWRCAVLEPRHYFRRRGSSHWNALYHTQDISSAQKDQLRGEDLFIHSVLNVQSMMSLRG